ncbi:MAG: T9SS type A sorting domain-containing protein, partial [Bacteroidetes bacterium]|nr:T9SS type A sorting domain-containing protein [Candidatus Limisoma faecipullorum]
RHYEYSISQESEITAAGELTSGGTGVFNVEMRNNSEEEAVGDLSYEIRKQADGSLAYEGTVRVGLPAYTTSTVSIEQPLTEDIFSEGAYTIAITGYLSATHTDFSYSSAFQPSAFLIGTSGADAIEAANVTVYPNPAKDFITVDCGEGISSVTIFSASGQLVKSIGGADAEGSIHIGNLPAGYYIVAVGTESGTTVRKQILKH